MPEYNQYDLSSFESVENMLRQIEELYVVSASDNALLSKRLEEYFSSKEHDNPSTVKAKWNEISVLLNSLEPKTEH